MSDVGYLMLESSWRLLPQSHEDSKKRKDFLAILGMIFKILA